MKRARKIVAGVLFTAFVVGLACVSMCDGFTTVVLTPGPGTPYSPAGR